MRSIVATVTGPLPPTLAPALFLGFTAGSIAGVTAAADMPVALTVEVSGLETSRGQVAIAVFDSPERFDARESPVARGRVPADGERVVWTAEIPAAAERIAVLVYQDLNGNGQIDFGRFGIPAEPYGFSNGARRPFGPPDFEAASFAPGNAGTVAIRLR